MNISVTIALQLALGGWWVTLAIYFLTVMTVVPGLGKQTGSVNSD